jgi:hypothetical protein
MSMKIGILLLVILTALTVSGQRCEYSTEGPTTVPYGHIGVEYKSRTVRVVKGTVVDANGDPLSSAAIVLSMIKNKERVFIGGTYSDEDGSFCFGAIPDGEYRLEVGLEGFNKAELILKVRSRGTTQDVKKVTLEVGT